MAYHALAVNEREMETLKEAARKMEEQRTSEVEALKKVNEELIDSSSLLEKRLVTSATLLV